VPRHRRALLALAVLLSIMVASCNGGSSVDPTARWGTASWNQASWGP